MLICLLVRQSAGEWAAHLQAPLLGMLQLWPPPGPLPPPTCLPPAAACLSPVPHPLSPACLQKPLTSTATAASGCFPSCSQAMVGWRGFSWGKGRGRGPKAASGGDFTLESPP